MIYFCFFFSLFHFCIRNDMPYFIFPQQFFFCLFQILQTFIHQYSIKPCFDMCHLSNILPMFQCLNRCILYNIQRRLFLMHIGICQTIKFVLIFQNVRYHNRFFILVHHLKKFSPHFSLYYIDTFLTPKV